MRTQPIPLHRSWKRLARALAGLASGFVVQAPAASLDGNTDLDSGTTPQPLPLQGGTQTIQYRATDEYWDFGDRNANGVRNEDAADTVTPAGLSMGNYDLFMDYTVNGPKNKPIKLNLNGGGITSVSGSIRTETPRTTQDIIVHNVGEISLGNGRLSTADTSGSYFGQACGDILLGEAGNRAGHIQANGLFTFSLDEGASGRIEVYGQGNVLVRNNSGVATNISVRTAGRIWPGTIEIRHDGAFLARDIDGSVNGKQGATLPLPEHLFDGDTDPANPGPSGAFVANDILTYNRGGVSGAGWIGSAMSLVIRGYTSVTARNLRLETEFGDYAGSLSITNISGDITITGIVNCDRWGNNAYDGNVMLQCGGRISVADLDLVKVGTISFNAGSGISYVTGALANFTGANDASLLAPAGHKIYYTPSLNPGLNQQTYRLRDLQGTSDAGGELAPRPSQGTVFRFR